MHNKIKVLAIETSCDETSAAVVERGNKVLSNVVSSQIDLHKKYGGVVPEIASRAHIEAINHVISEALINAKVSLDKIDAIAVTLGPGLLGSLLIGANTGKTLSYLSKKPLIPVHHLEGHIYANFVDNKPNFPLLAIVVSGGHTSIVYMEGHLTYDVVGKTIDDAVGEVFDKVAKILNFGYPGGPIISKLAEKGNEDAYSFPRTDLTPKPERDEKGFLKQSESSLNFSFSGLKTAVLNVVRENPEIIKDNGKIADLCASFQQAAIDILVRNSLTAINKYNPKTFLLAGGVAANKELRKQLELSIPKNISFHVPEFNLCTDNAAMIGIAGYYKLKKGVTVNWQEVKVDPNLKL